MKNIKDITKFNYRIEEDMRFYLDATGKTLEQLSNDLELSKTTLNEVKNNNCISDSIYEKLYAYIYSQRFSLNTVKAELLKETKDIVLFHGSKEGLINITYNGSRSNCDFGAGFYLGESYEQALYFVCENEKSSVYSFKTKIDNLKIVNFDMSLDWMLAICYFRGSINKYRDCKKVQAVVKKINDADLIVAPIADNRMFFVMSSFADGDINVDAALHSLSASPLGKQYVFKSKKAIETLVPIEKYYLSIPEKTNAIKALENRGYEIETKLKLAKREFRNGLYIDEVLK